MKLTYLLAAPALASALPFESMFKLPIDWTRKSLMDGAEEKRLIQLGENEEPIWVSESEKLRLKRKGKNFFDVTELYRDAAENDNVYLMTMKNKKVYEYPKELNNTDVVKALNAQIVKDNLYSKLEKFSSFHTRYYKSSYGVESAEWLFDQISEVIKPNPNIYVEKFEHKSWPQFSTIVTIPGKSYKSNKDKGKVVILGAHQDSINLFLPSLMAAPGADDDGSGTVTILEALRIIASIPEFVPENTIEFHFYSAEEGGLLGSQDVFNAYHKQNVDVISMVQMDMTGFNQKTLDQGLPQSIALITDLVDLDLTEFLKLVIKEYCSIGSIETTCNYGCSDHASANKFGYQSAFVFESDFTITNPNVHTIKDTVDKLDFKFMTEFVKLAIGYVYEMGSTEF